MIYEDEKFEGYGTDSLLDRNVTKLSDVISDAEDVVKYVYDFGDYWRHSVEIEATQDTETKMVLPELRLSKFSGLRLTPMNCEILFKLFQLCFPLFRIAIFKFLEVMHLPKHRRKFLKIIDAPVRTKLDYT